jgi:hypothetical protein
MLNWLRAEGLCALDHNMCAGAAAAGRLAVLKHLRSEGCDWDEDVIAYDAVSGGSVEVVECLRQQDVEFEAESMTWAAGAGQTTMCKHLRSIGCDWDADVCYQAAIGGHVDTLRWLLESGCPWNANAVVHDAARHNHTDILELVTEQGVVLSAELLADALNQAGARNQLPAAQWLRQHGAQWPAALKCGTTQWKDDMIAWARAQGCTSPTTL